MSDKKEGAKKVLIFATIVILSGLGLFYKKFMSSQPQSYTVGVVKHIWKPRKGGTQVKYEYTIDGELYRGDVSNNGYESVAKPGKRFLVHFPKEYKWEGIMMLDVPVPEEIIPPPHGWEDKPTF